MTVTLRPARSTDAGSVGAILSDFIDATEWMPRLHTRAQDIGFAGRMIDRGWVTVAEIDQVVGFMARDGAEIDALYLAASAQRQGIGSQLIETAKSASDKLTLWTFQANYPARKFYESHGFVDIRRTDGAGNDEGLPDIRYAWERTVQ